MSKKSEVDISNVIGKQLRSGKNYQSKNVIVDSKSVPSENVSNESLNDGMSNWNYWNNWNYSEPDLSLDVSNTVLSHTLLTPNTVTLHFSCHTYLDSKKSKVRDQRDVGDSNRTSGDKD